VAASMSSGTRAAVAAAADAESARPAARVQELEIMLLTLTGKANQSERNRLNKELWALQNQHTSAPPQPHLPAAPLGCSADNLQQLLSHWQVLRPEGLDPLALCARCGDGRSPTCRFHPDAKGFAFGTGRFDYAYESLFDTPHDRWLCCGSTEATCAGCVEEANHTTDLDWWRAYAHLSPPLPAGDDSDDDDSCEDDSMDAVTDGAAAMEIS